MTERRLSIGRLAIAVVAAGTVVLALTTVAVVALKPPTWIAVVLVVAGIVCAIGAMSRTSRAVLRRAEDPQGTDSGSD